MWSGRNSRKPSSLKQSMENLLPNALTSCRRVWLPGCFFVYTHVPLLGATFSQLGLLSFYLGSESDIRGEFSIHMSLLLTHTLTKRMGLYKFPSRWYKNTEKEKYTLLNAEIQRIARRDKKAFLSDQCKEIEGNNRMGKTRDLFKKIRDTKGTFHAKMGSKKDRNGMDLTEAEDIKKVVRI